MWEEEEGESNLYEKIQYLKEERSPKEHRTEATFYTLPKRMLPETLCL